MSGSKPKFKFCGAEELTDGKRRLFWVSESPIPNSSQHVMYSCGADWFWNGGK